MNRRLAARRLLVSVDGEIEDAGVLLLNGVGLVELVQHDGHGSRDGLELALHDALGLALVAELVKELDEIVAKRGRRLFVHL